jgi:hypothetical protein
MPRSGCKALPGSPGSPRPAGRQSPPSVRRKRNIEPNGPVLYPRSYRPQPSRPGKPLFPRIRGAPDHHHRRNGRKDPHAAPVGRGALAKPCAATRRVPVPTVIVSPVIRIAMVEPPLPGGPAKQDQTKDQRTQISPDRVMPRRHHGRCGISARHEERGTRPGTAQPEPPGQVLSPPRAATRSW